MRPTSIRLSCATCGWPMRFILACRKKYFRAPPFAKKESGSPHRALNAVSVEVVGTIRRRCIARTRVPRSRWNMTPGGFRAVPGPDPGRVRVVSPGVRGPAGRVRQRGARAVVRRARCTWTRWELRGAAPSAIAAKVSLLVVPEIGPLWLALIRRALSGVLDAALEFGPLVLIEDPSRFLAVVVCPFSVGGSGEFTRHLDVLMFRGREDRRFGDSSGWKGLPLAWDLLSFVRCFCPGFVQMAQRWRRNIGMRRNIG